MIAAILLLVIPTAATPAQLIRDLADTSFQVREQAYQKLLEMGVAAKPTLETGAASSDPEVRGRCRELLSRLALEQWDARSKAFLDAKTDLPGWKYYRELIPNAERRKFADIYRAGKDLFEAIERDPQEAQRLLLTKTMEVHDRFLTSPQSVQLPELLSLLIVTDDPRTNAGVPGQKALLTCLETLTLWKEVREKMQKDDSARLLLLELANKLPDAALLTEALELFFRLEMKEGLPLAKHKLADRKLAPATRAAALVLVAKVGSKDDLADVRACLDDTGIVGQKVLRGATLGVQLRDVALAMMIHLHGENPADYGFPYLRAIPGPPLSYSPTCFGFANANDRAAAFESWAKRGQ